jgi:hypothetical protein
VSRAVSIRDIDVSQLGPDSPLRELLNRKPKRDLEHQEQRRVFEWAAENEGKYPELRWLFAVPNWIGVRTAKQGARLKAEGRKPGVPDMFLPIVRGNWCGLVIELKVANNTVSREQQQWISHLHRNRWVVVVAYGADTAIKELEWYLNQAA